MANEARLRYGTFRLRAAPDGVIHLDPVELPEVVAIGSDAMLEMLKGVWPLGGPHCDVRRSGRRIHVVTPEAVFTYDHIATKTDTAGPYFLFRLTYTNDTYRAFLAGR
jgi:hypothetical protein